MGECEFSQLVVVLQKDGQTRKTGIGMNNVNGRKKQVGARALAHVDTQKKAKVKHAATATTILAGMYYQNRLAAQARIFLQR